MELTEKQKRHLLGGIGEGLKTREINKRAALFVAPYTVSRQQVDFYRKTRDVSLQEITTETEAAALREGFANKVERVEALSTLASLMYRELVDEGRLWLPTKRAIGSGEHTQIITQLNFNSAQVAAFYKALDELAKETLERTYQRREVIADDEGDDDEGTSSGEVKVTIEYESVKATE